MLNIIRARGALLALPRGIITRDYQGSQTTIDLLFVTDLLANRIISYGVDEKIENFLDYLLIKTILNLEIQKEPERPRRRNWKAINIKKFKNTLLAKVPDLLLNKIVGRQRIEEYTKELFYTIKEAVKELTPWTKSSEQSKGSWTPECILIIKKIRRIRRNYRTP